MSPSPDMKFRLRDLPESREFGLDEAFVRDALSAIAGQASLVESPGHVNLVVEVTEEHQQTVFARGRLEGRISVACNRCLGPVEMSVSEEFSLTFLPQADCAEADKRGVDADDDDEVELDNDDIDVGMHDGSTVDISEILRDHIVLSVPYAPLCSDECKGLCAHCGADLNQSQCECEPVADSRWAALENLELK